MWLNDPSYIQYVQSTNFGNFVRQFRQEPTFTIDSQGSELHIQSQHVSMVKSDPELSA